MMTMIKTTVLSLLCASSVAAFAPHASGSSFVGGSIASVRSQGGSFRCCCCSLSLSSWTMARMVPLMLACLYACLVEDLKCVATYRLLLCLMRTPETRESSIASYHASADRLVSYSPLSHHLYSTLLYIYPLAQLSSQHPLPKRHSFP
jgi:hypothetical protein